MGIESWGATEDVDLLFLGDSPSLEDERAGKVMMGESGKILRSVLSGMSIDIARCSFANVVPERIASGRPPSAKKIREWESYLNDLISCLSPRVVVPMGNEALMATLGGQKITKRRGVYQEKNGQAYIPTVGLKSLGPDNYPDLVDDIGFIREVLAGEEPVIPPPYENYVMIREQRLFDRLMSRLATVTLAAVDIETTGLSFMDDSILSIGISWARERAVVLDWQELIAGNPDNRKRLSEALSCIPCSFHHGQFDVLWLWHNGIDADFSWDTMLLHYCSDERQGCHGLERLAISRYKAPDYEETIKKQYGVGSEATDEHHKSYGNIPIEALMSYNGADADYQFRLTEDLIAECEEADMMPVFQGILLPAAKHFIDLERNGISVDREFLDFLGDSWYTKMTELERKMREYSGAEEINFNSPTQVKRFLYEDLGLTKMHDQEGKVIPQGVILEQTAGIEDEEAQNFWKSASSQVFGKMKPDSTSTYMLYWLAQQHEFPRMMVDYRVASKYYDTYYIGIKDRLGSDGRIRPQYKLHGTRTGRLSSTNPNIHGMPRKGDIKNAFVADPGNIMIHADYSQAEIRMMAHFARDEKLIELMKESDIHEAISLELFGMTKEEQDALGSNEKKYRRRAAKTIAFGIIYGRGVKSLAPQLGCSVDEAAQYQEAFFDLMPDVPAWISRQQSIVMRNQEVSSLFGRKRRFGLITERNAHEVKRQAVNMPIQSSVSDITLMAHFNTVRKLREAGVNALVGPMIHDAIIFQVPEIHSDYAYEITKQVMGDVPFETEVHFAIEIEAGYRWGDLKGVYKG